MSYHVFFEFSEGLSAPLKVPKGTLASTLEHVQHIESALGFETEQYRDNPPRWKNKTPKPEVSDKDFCLEAEWHNRWVESLYHHFGEWSEKPVADGEEITPEDANSFWHALTMIDVPPSRWTEDYYRSRMTSLYEVMRGRENEGVSFNEKPLTPKQAGAVILLFETYLDAHDLRLDVPKGCDHLATSQDEGYEYCDKCGLVTREHFRDCKRRGCPVKKEYKAMGWDMPC
ncbi:MAG TPA: hypothetical protein DCS05_08775 [Nitrospiraceae bacterium]|nr:hypothetical protein [Nitrospiraceae bacterium]